MNNSYPLETEERELLDSYERDEWKPIGGTSEALRVYKTYATSALEAAGIVSIHLPQQDLVVLEQRAAEAGMSYQTLIANILHQYLTGHLVEKPRGV